MHRKIIYLEWQYRIKAVTRGSDFNGKLSALIN